MRIPQRLALGRGDTVGEPGIHPPLRLPPVQGLFWDTDVSHQTHDTFTSEHAINESLPKSSRILTRHNDPLSVQPAFPHMRNEQIQGVRSIGPKKGVK